MGGLELVPDLQDALGGAGTDVFQMRLQLLGNGSRDFRLDLGLGILGAHFSIDNRKNAAAHIPDILGDQDEANAARHHRNDLAEHRADHALADALGQICQRPARHQDHCARDQPFALDGEVGVGHVGATRAGGLLKRLASIVGHQQRHRCAIARPQEGAHTGDRGRGGVERGQFDAAGNLFSDVGRDRLDGPVHFLRAIGPLRHRGRQSLRRFARGEALQQRRPAGLFLNLGDRLGHALIQRQVRARLAPGDIDQGGKFDPFQAFGDGRERQGVDGVAERFLVRHLAVGRQRRAGLEACCGRRRVRREGRRGGRDEQRERRRA